ncbi:hypothetical protein GCM10028813_10850 [Ramlibacter alkalitolerans]|nr:toll/interleukin-1 receptor domain-containing protein [Ramlibacter alkalitolerans]
MPQAGAGGLKIFVSYSRKDLAFADQLVASLEALGHKVVIDRSGIQGAERWEARLGQMILEADTIVFILTPASAASPVCRWELEQAGASGKRIVPVLAGALAPDTQVPGTLGTLNYIHFYAEPSFPGAGWGSGLARLQAALRVDIEWIREHTRVAEMAARWQAEASAPDFLARGSELAHLQQWRDARPAGAPELTGAQRSFLQASEQAEAYRLDEERQQIERMRRAQEGREQALQASTRAQEDRARALRLVVRRTIVGIAVTGVLTLAVAGAGYVAWRNGEKTKVALRQVQEERNLQDRLIRLAHNRDYPAPPYSVDTLARRYEGETPEHFGTDFIGGRYYGTFRIRADAQMEEFLGFLDQWKPEQGARLVASGAAEAARRGDPAFERAWHALGTEAASAEDFARLQSAFVEKTVYRPLVRRLGAGARTDGAASPVQLDVERRSIALQAVMFSIAVQYGPNSPLVRDALGGLGNLSEQSDETIIRRLYAYRDKVEQYFPGIEAQSSNFAALIRERNHWELTDALHMLKQPG